MQKSLLTEVTFIRKTSLVCLQMIVHRILLLLRNVTVRTHVEALRIFRVRIGHSSRMAGGPGRFNFYVTASTKVKYSLYWSDLNFSF